MTLYDHNSIYMIAIVTINQFKYINPKIYFIVLINIMQYIFQFAIYIKEPPSDIPALKY